MTNRRPVYLSGLNQPGSTMTKFYLPGESLERLNALTGPRGRSHWIADCVNTIVELDHETRLWLILRDVIIRSSPLHLCPVRLNSVTYTQVRYLLAVFRQSCPGQDLDSSGVLRTATLWGLHRTLGPARI